jgi:hypothetical protein
LPPSAASVPARAAGAADAVLPWGNSVEGKCDEVAADVGDMKKATRVGGCFSLAAAPVLRAPGRSSGCWQQHDDREAVSRLAM